MALPSKSGGPPGSAPHWASKERRSAGPVAFERARELNTIIFDKTGTLTEGGFSITDTITNGKRAENEN
ncbi:MAG: hypothetical protein V3W34_14390 [Phycisphaerae bacterium]